MLITQFFKNFFSHAKASKQNYVITENVLRHNCHIISQNVDTFYYDCYLRAAPNISLEDYYTLYCHYFILLEHYFATRLPLSKYDDQIRNSNLRFFPASKSKYYTPSTKMPFFQKEISTFGLEYINLLATPALHLIPQNDIFILLDLQITDLSSPSPSLMNLIERTYVDVLVRNDVPHLVHHLNHNLFGAVVFEICIDFFRKNGLSDDQWAENHFKQCDFLNIIKKRMEEEFSQILGVKVLVVYH